MMMPSGEASCSSLASKEAQDRIALLQLQMHCLQQANSLLRSQLLPLPATHVEDQKKKGKSQVVGAQVTDNQDSSMYGALGHNNALMVEEKIAFLEKQISEFKRVDSFLRSQIAETQEQAKSSSELYAEEKKKREAVEQVLKDVRNDLEKLRKEADDQKTLLEEKLSIQEKQISDLEQSNTFLRSQILEAETRAKIFEDLYNSEITDKEDELGKHNTAFESGLPIFQDQLRDSLHVLMECAATVLEKLPLDGQLSTDSTSTRMQTKPYSSFCSSLSPYEIVEATNGFSSLMYLGDNDCGNIYKGLLYGTPITVRLFSVEGAQGSLKFQREVEILSQFRHPNVATLMGVCQKTSAIIYEHFPNGNLEDRLIQRGQTPPLSWQKRVTIALELCSALVYLHSNKPHRVVHCALRPSCIFFDSNFTCKITDFTSSHITSSYNDNSISSTTMSSSTSFYCNSSSNPYFTQTGYTDPELVKSRVVSPKVDIYSFGVILLQLLTGKVVVSCIVEEVQHALLEDQLDAVLDGSAGDWPFLLAEQLARLGLRCCDLDWSSRPDLRTDVWRVLEPMKGSCGSGLSFRVEEPPSYFMCPITHEIMRDPHVAMDGHTYEADVLRQWLASGRNTSPMTNLPLDNNLLIPNLPLRSAIQEWEQHQ